MSEPAANPIIPFLFTAADTPLPVRVILREGDPWFVAVDICRILAIKQPVRAVEGLDDDEKALADLHGALNTVTTTHGITAPRGNPNAYIVSESGLYALIFRSRKPAARAFRKWVISEVLPSLRRTGTYASPGADMRPEARFDHPRIEAFLHQHQLRVLAAVRGLANPDGDTRASFAQLARVAGISAQSTWRAVALLSLLGLIDLAPTPAVCRLLGGLDMELGLPGDLPGDLASDDDATRH